MNRFAYVALVCVSISMGDVYAYGEFELEPCINGAVSSTGLFPTQALEDKARRAAIQNAANKKATTGDITTNERVKARAVETSAR